MMEQSKYYLALTKHVAPRAYKSSFGSTNSASRRNLTTLAKSGASSSVFEAFIDEPSQRARSRTEGNNEARLKVRS